MSLREKINEQFNIALKSKNKTLISTFRLILAAIKEKDIANRTGENKDVVKDAEIIKVLKKMKKQRQDSADLYKKGNRQELLDAEEAEIKIIDTFLPKQLSDEETKKICKQIIESSGNFGTEHRWQAKIENFDSGERAAKTPYYRVVRIFLKIIGEKGKGEKEFLLETLTWTPNG